MRVPRVSMLASRTITHYTIPIITIVILALMINAPALCQEPLLLGIYPYLPCAQLEKRFAPLATYLSKEIGQPVVVRIGSSYQEHITAIGRNQIDIAYIGPAEYVLMRKKYGPKPLIVCQETDGSTTFRGIIMVRNDNPASSLADLGKGEFAFVDPHSTMGYLLPQIMLQHENPLILAKQPLPVFKTHKNVALGILTGDFAAGAVNEAVYQQFKSRGLKILAATPPIAEHLFVARTTLAETGVKVLQSIKPSLTGFSPVTDDAYNSLRQLLDQQEKKAGAR